MRINKFIALVRSQLRVIRGKGNKSYAETLINASLNFSIHKLLILSELTDSTVLKNRK